MDSRTHAGNQDNAALPQEALAALLESVPQEKLLRLLKQNAPLCQQVFQGFTVQLPSLRVPVVRRRLRERLEADEEFLVEVVALWDRQNPVVRREVQQRSVSALRRDLPQLAAQWGGGLLALALAADPRASVRALLDSQAPILEQFPRHPSDSEFETSNLDPLIHELIDSPDVRALREEVERYQEKYAALRQQHQDDLRALEQARIAHRQATQQVAALQKQLKEVEARCAALEKQADRASRQKQKVEREKQDLQAETKRLKKQVRQLTLAVEELRRQVSQQSARLQATDVGSRQSAGNDEEKSAGSQQLAEKSFTADCRLPTADSTALRPLSVSASVLRWHINGDRHSVPIPQLVRAVDTNQEVFVFKVADDLKRLRQHDAAQFAAVVQQLRRIGRYYAQVLTQPTMRVLVDGSNVAHAEKNQRGQAQLRNLFAMRDALRALDFFPILVYADASLPYQIDQPDELQRLIQRGEVRLVPAGTSADDTLAREARDFGCYVVTNDRRLSHNLDPTWELQTVGFKIVDGQVLLEEF